MEHLAYVAGSISPFWLSIYNIWHPEFFECLDRIPIESEPEIFEANTPFTASLRIKETLAGFGPG